MDCAKCGTWNPDDKIRCWRCGAELPKPPEPKKRQKLSSQTWVWIIAILFFVLTMLIQCGLLRGGDSGNEVGSLWSPAVHLLSTLI